MSSLLARLPKTGMGLIAVEATGGYERPLAEALEIFRSRGVDVDVRVGLKKAELMNIKMEASAQARRALELDLRSATESEAFELHYQPIFNLKTRRIETCEALLRWPHRERGMVSPAEFIPVAEEMGLIVEIGNQALYKACLECRRWPGDTAVVLAVRR